MKPSPRPGALAPWIISALCAIGMVVSGLSTWDHVEFRRTAGTAVGLCSALVDSGCRAAHSSETAELWGIPISHYGSGFYLAGAALAVLALIRRRRGRTTEATSGIPLAVALMGLAATAYSAFLASVLVRSGEACPFCIALYCVNAGLLATGLVWWLRGQRRVRIRSILLPVVLAAVVGGGAFAATTPFVLGAMEPLPMPMPWTVAKTASTGDVRLSTSGWPERLPSKGERTAEDSLVEFSDFHCPHCASLHRTVAALFEGAGPMGLRVRFVNYPLDPECNPHVPRLVHPGACVAARGGLCAQEQGRFWPFAEAYFGRSDPRSRSVVLDTAREVGLEMERFAECLDAATTADALAEDITLAHAAGVSATPTVLVNGWAFEGAIPREQLLRALNDTIPCGCERQTPDGICSPAVVETCAEEPVNNEH